MIDLAASMTEYRGVITAITWVIISVGMIQNLMYFLQIPVAWQALRKYTAASDVEISWQALISDTAIPIAVIVPAHNEEGLIVDSVRCLLALQYQEIEIIVVNDGSDDGTLDALIEAYGLEEKVRARNPALSHEPIKAIYKSRIYSNLVVVDKVAGSCKADAINAGINVSRLPLFCVIDSDSLLESGALLRAVRPFVEDSRRMVAVGGTIRVVNGCEIKNGQVYKRRLPRQFIPLVQSLEYIRAFLMARTALSQWNILLIISGAFGIFRRDTVVEVGGYSKGTVGEDMELIIKLHRHLCEQKRDYTMRYVAEPVCWTQVPDSWRSLGRQRTRWQRGALESFFKHIRMFMNPRYGRIGMIAFPYSFLSDVLGPVAEVMGYVLLTLFYITDMIDLSLYLAFAGLVVFYGVFISVSALVLEEEELWKTPRTRDLAILFLVAIVENFGYRQMNNVWRVIGGWQFLRGKEGWEKMERTAFLSAE